MHGHIFRGSTTPDSRRIDRTETESYFSKFEETAIQNLG